MYAKIDHTNPQLSITFIILTTLYNWFVNCFTFKCSCHHDWILIMWNQKLTVWSWVSKGNTRYSIVTQLSYLDNDLHFTIDNGYYFGKTLPMGLSFTCQLFEELSTVVHWVCENKSGLCGRLVYQLHDFLVLTQKNLY